MSKNKKTFGSLRDQLKDAGLVTAKQAKKAARGALRTELRIKKGIDVDAVKQEVEAARTQKIEADRPHATTTSNRLGTILARNRTRPVTNSLLQLNRVSPEH